MASLIRRKSLSNALFLLIIGVATIVLLPRQHTPVNLLENPRAPAEHVLLGPQSQAQSRERLTCPTHHGVAEKSDEIITELPRVLQYDWDEASTELSQHAGGDSCGNSTTSYFHKYGRGDIQSQPSQTGGDRVAEHYELLPVKTLQPGRLLVACHPHFGNTPVLVKMATSPGDIRSALREITTYHLLAGLHVTPLLLGYVARAGRIVGFVTEYVHAQENPAKAVLNRRRACLDALRQMHKKGIAHGDAHSGNCLIREDGSAAIIDFELSLETSSQAQFERDLDIMNRTTRH